MCTGIIHVKHVYSCQSAVAVSINGMVNGNKTERNIKGLFVHDKTYEKSLERLLKYIFSSR